MEYSQQAEGSQAEILLPIIVIIDFNNVWPRSMFPFFLSFSTFALTVLSSREKKT